MMILFYAIVVDYDARDDKCIVTTARRTSPQRVVAKESFSIRQRVVAKGDESRRVSELLFKAITCEEIAIASIDLDRSGIFSR